MKYIKKYESVNPNSRLDELKKLLSHFVSMFKELGYGHQAHYDEYQYVNNFYNQDFKNNFDRRAFDIDGEFSNSLIFLSVTMRIASVDDELVEFIPDYLKTISGLKLYSENPGFFNTQFEIVDNVDNIIDQISIKDFELKADRKKFNI